MASSEAPGLSAKIMNIVQRPFKSLPLAIDAPRLAANFDVRRGAEAVWAATPGTPVHETLRSLLLTLIRALDGAALAARFEADYGRYMQVLQDLPKSLERFMEEVLGGDACRTVQLLKAANQAIIGPAVVELKLTLGPAYMTKDVRGWWRVEVQLEAASERVEIVTRKRDVCVRGSFLLEWTLAVAFAAPPAPAPLAPADVRFGLTLVRYGAALRAPSEAARLSTLRAVLARYASPHVMADADAATDWAADSPPNYMPLAAPAAAAAAAAPTPLTVSPAAAPTIARTGSTPEPGAGAAKASAARPVLVSSADAAAAGSPPAGAPMGASRSTPSVGGGGWVKPAHKTSTSVAVPGAASSPALASSPTTAAASSPGPRLTPLSHSLGRALSSDALLPGRGSRIERASADGGDTRLITYSNGDTYEGQIAADGRREGRGTYTTAQGDVYVGQYAAGARNGHGVYTRKDGSRYEGDFKDGCPHGQGVYVFEDGSIYRGAFAADEFHGRGRWSSLRGDYYEGEYRRGKRHGQGVLMVQGTRYEGEWEDDARCGHGRLELSNGDWYEGGFHAGKFHGKGRYHFAATNATVEASFRNGKPVSAKGGTV